jgi:hypothetical protein
MATVIPSSASADFPSGLRYSAVSWGAILGGAFIGAASALILLLLGAGLGLSAASPWSGEGLSAKAIGIGAMIWMVVAHLVSSALTGYTAGRLRTRWEGLDGDEVVFRDTAHGFVAWSVGIVISAAFLASAASSVVGGVAKTGAEVAGTAATAGAAAGAAKAGEGGLDAQAYSVDALFRSDKSGTGGAADDAEVRREAGHILANAVREGGEVPAADRTHLSRLVAAKTGMSQPDADKRVSEVIEKGKQAKLKAQEAADAARKAGAHAALWSVLALLIGAFTASLAATFGGRLRDLYN